MALALLARKYASGKEPLPIIKSHDAPKCGHPAEMIYETLESHTLICRVCDLENRVRDAESQERRLLAEVDSMTTALRFIAGHEGKTLLGEGTYQDGVHMGFGELAHAASAALDSPLCSVLSEERAFFRAACEERSRINAYNVAEIRLNKEGAESPGCCTCAEAGRDPGKCAEAAAELADRESDTEDAARCADVAWERMQEALALEANGGPDTGGVE